MQDKWECINIIESMEQEIGSNMLDIEYDSKLVGIYTAGSVENIWQFLDIAILSNVRDSLYDQIFI